MYMYGWITLLATWNYHFELFVMFLVLNLSSYNTKKFIFINIRTDLIIFHYLKIFHYLGPARFIAHLHLSKFQFFTINFKLYYYQKNNCTCKISLVMSDCEFIDCKSQGSSVRVVLQARVLSVCHFQGILWPRDKPVSLMSPA